MNLSTQKVIESAHVKVDEFVERTEEEIKIECEDYRRFVFIEPDIVPGTPVNHKSSTPESSVTKLQEVQTELMPTELQGPELQIEATELTPTEPEQPESEPEVET